MAVPYDTKKYNRFKPIIRNKASAVDETTLLVFVLNITILNYYLTSGYENYNKKTGQRQK